MVGAGAAGLAAAAKVRGAGRSVLVVEARSRLGGRIRTLRPCKAGGPVELGAEFVHGEAPLSRALLRQAGATLAPLEGAPWRADGGRIEIGDQLWARIERVLATLDAEREPDRPFAAHLRAHRDDIARDDAELARAFVEGFHAADPERASARALAGEGTEGATDALRVREGYDRLVELLAERVDRAHIALGRAVRRVVWRRGHVELETVRADDGAEPAPIGARGAIVTVPIGVLKQPEARGSLRFDPPLADVERALDGIAMGSVVRLTLGLERAPWAGDALLPEPSGASGPPSILHTPSERFNAFWCTVDGGGLVAWSGGARARGLPDGVDALRTAALDVLAHAAGADRERLARALVGAWTHDWRADPWSGGAYSYVQVGGTDAPHRLARPIEDTIFLAGEGTSADGIGTVEGALASGERAAEAALAALD